MSNTFLIESLAETSARNLNIPVTKIELISNGFFVEPHYGKVYGAWVYSGSSKYLSLFAHSPEDPDYHMSRLCFMPM